MSDYESNNSVLGCDLLGSLTNRNKNDDRQTHNNYRYHILNLLDEAKCRQEDFAKLGYGDTRDYVSFDRGEIKTLIALMENELGSVERTLGN